MAITDLLNIKVLAHSATELLKSVMEIEPKIDGNTDSTTIRPSLLTITIECECAIRELRAIIQISKNLLDKPPPYDSQDETANHRDLEMKIRCQKTANHGIEAERNIWNLPEIPEGLGDAGNVCSDYHGC